MCLGGGGGYEPPKQVAAAPAVAGGPPPDDMVNGQVIPNANPRDEMKLIRMLWILQRKRLNLKFSQIKIRE